MDLNTIKRLIKLVESSEISEFAIEEDNVKIEIKKASQPETVATVVQQPVPVSSPMPAALPVSPAPAVEDASQAQAAPAEDAGLTPIKSPMVGTFYASPNPESPAYVKIGDSVSDGAVVCIVEAMKLFNEIESEISGTIEKVCVESGAPVEYGQTLFLVRA